MKKTLSTLLLLLFLIGSQWFAATILSNDIANIPWGKADFYVAGSTISIASPIDWDLRSAGNSMMIDKQISQDAVLASNMVSINAAVGDDLKIAANQVSINASVGGDLIVFANSVIIWKDVVIWWDLIVWSAKLVLHGKVNGDAKLYVWSIELDWSINGHTTIRSNDIIVATWVTLWSLDYTSKVRNPSLEATTSGAQFHVDTIWNKRDQDKQYLQENKKWIIAWIIWAVITFKFLSLLVTTLILWFVFKHRYGRAAEVVKAQPWKSFWIGLATLVGLPIAWMLLMFTWLLAAFGGLIIALWIFTLIFAEVALILVATWRLHQSLNPTNKAWKDVLFIVILSLLCAFITGIDSFFSIFAIGALILLKKDSLAKVMSDYYPIKKPLA